MLSGFLTREGHEVHIAATGASARNLVDGAEFAMILLDRHLPDEDGQDILSYLREKAGADRLPVIMVTAAGSSAEIVQALEAGANDYVTKPVDLHVLRARIEVHLRLRSSLEDKEILLRELHHRVKNNLQLVMSLLNLHRRKLEHNALEVISDLEDRVRVMAVVHEQLFQSKNLSSLDMAVYLKRLVDDLVFSSGRDVATTLDIDPVWFTAEKAIPCGLIINEMVTNWLKYGLATEGRSLLTISLKSMDGYLELIISDNGPGPSAPQGEGLGLLLVDALRRQLRATKDPESRPGRFQIQIPMPEKST